MPAWFYILRLRSSSLYTGSTRYLEKRIQDHFAGKACRTTRIDPPRYVAYVEEYSSISEAHRREKQIKGWSRAKKEALIRGDLYELKRLSKARRKTQGPRT